MIISKKRFQEEINKAVNKALDEQNERRWMDERFRDIDRSIDYRMDKINERIRNLEIAVFQNKNEECCQKQEAITPCRY